MAGVLVFLSLCVFLYFLIRLYFKNGESLPGGGCSSGVCNVEIKGECECKTKKD